MPSIEHQRTEIVPGAYHHSWVRKDDNGNVTDRFDGWPTKPNGEVDGNPLSGYGKSLTVKNNNPVDGTADIVDTYTGSDKDIDTRWQSGQSAADQINASPPSYQGDSRINLDTHEPERATNSNSAAYTLGKSMGFSQDDTEPDNSPGWGRDLLPNYTPPTPITPVPLSSTGPDDGGASLTDQDATELTSDFASRNAALMDDDA